ncbi:P450 FAMILY 81 SUBFAMILY D POLYPEPTIDE 8 putative-RELATED [Salix purpurea]|uniref:P450 FAMILY 81 SUBFAMILY D POLYPEPTIDE 8 putative-RELATED n=1 Tax=Salix purpurea TaxID=77065 RepID=A0A9Q0V2T1_SALPP|nr:P450 FAMILY 81 SUBFAMILY D POLYPEPTIDE 8 putative-RELATED [Salix purpurea]
MKQPIYQTIHNLSQRYGPIMSLRFGSRFVIIVNSPEAVEECFTKNDVILANRPPFCHGKYLNYNFTTMGAANYGDHWRNLRRIGNNEIFSPKRLNGFQELRKKEVGNLMKRVARVSGENAGKVELRSMILDLTFNIVMTMLAGKRYYGEDVSELEEALQFRDMMNQYGEFAKETHLGDLFPALSSIDYNGFVKRMKTLSKNMDLFLQRLLDEHRADRDRNTMINHLLTLQETQPQLYTDSIIKGLVMIMAVAGTRTSAASLEWAICNLLNNRHVLKKAKEELDAQLGQDQLIEEPDITKLHYLQGIISENLRLYPVAAMLVPHVASEHCTIGGYDVPPGTMVFANAWSIQRDPKVWDDPFKLQAGEVPERKNWSVQADAVWIGKEILPRRGPRLQIDDVDSGFIDSMLRMGYG